MQRKWKRIKSLGTCFIVTAGRQSFSSSNSERHTVPDGYTFGWNNGGSNLPETFPCNYKHYASLYSTLLLPLELLLLLSIVVLTRLLFQGDHFTLARVSTIGLE